MALIEKRGPTATDLRWFGLMAAAFFALLGALSWWQGHPWRRDIAWTAAAAVAIGYYLLPPARAPFFRLWLGIVYPIGWAVSHLLMAFVYYVVLTPTGLGMRLLGRDPIQRGFDRAADTYWKRHEARRATARYFKQF